MNKIIIIGNAVEDVNLQYTKSQTAWANIRLAVKKSMPNQNGEYEAMFFDVMTYNKRAELACRVTKGCTVAIEGELVADSYTNKEGNKVVKYFILGERIEIVKKPTNNTTEQQKQVVEPRQVYNQIQNEVNDSFDPRQEFSVDDENLPF